MIAFISRILLRGGTKRQTYKNDNAIEAIANLNYLIEFFWDKSFATDYKTKKEYPGKIYITNIKFALK